MLINREKAAAEIERRAAAVEQRERELQEIESLDEMTLMERIAGKRGMSLDDLLRRGIERVANGGKPTNEMVTSEAAERARRAEERVMALEARLAAEAQERQAQLQAEADRQLIDEMRSEAESLISDTEHPILSAYETSAVAHQALRIANTYAERTGEVPAMSEVLAYLEQQEAARIDALAARAGYTKAQAAAVIAAEAEAETEAEAAPRGAGSGSANMTRISKPRRAPAAVTNGTAAQRGASPVDYRKMDARARIAEAAKVLSG